jgi:hypothetical protein
VLRASLCPEKNAPLNADTDITANNYMSIRIFQIPSQLF